ncbi:MAG: peptidoglycan DD-metalloendopeptidase family protein [Alphaproteobacteria bacterium]|nr:peptidoglycan DD-metalloendopeptidase family protein [Alphaproteobacteria bacterium]
MSLPVFAVEDPADELREAQSSLAAAKAAREKLSDEAGRISGELSSLQRELASMAEKLQSNEDQLTRLEAEYAGVTEKIRQSEQALEKRELEHGQMVESLVRLSSMPPEAMLLAPGDAKNTFVTETALAGFMKELRRQAEELRLQLTELETMKEDAAKRQEAMLKDKLALKEARQKLDGKVRERTALLKEASEDDEQLVAQITRLSKQSKSLRELLEKLEASRAAAEKKRKEASERRSKPAKERYADTGDMRSIVDAKGRLRMPASGRFTATPEGMGGGNGASGIAIASREHAQVISPFDGEVVYAGAFRGYGNMVIIRHSDGYHSLIAGLEKIDCVPGQMVVEGEPVGTMGGADANHTLYLELRENGKPIDPKPWLESRSKG